MPDRRLLLAFAIAVATSGTFATAIRPARADGGDVAHARKVFADGVKLYQSGDWEGARRLFREAEAAHHAPAIVYNIGLAEEKLGHPQAAVDAYEAYLRETGDKGDLSSAAAAAIVQVKARSTQLRIETRPPGARILVDGALLPDPAPSALLVTGGHHLVRAEGEGWRDERDVETKGTGDQASVVLEAAVAAAAEPPRTEVPIPPIEEAKPPVAVAREVSPPTPGEAVPDGVVWQASFAIVPIYLLGVSTVNAENKSAALSILAGPELGIGLALSDRLELFARGFVGIGPDAKPSYGFAGGPGLSYRAASFLWLGGTFIGGQIETRRDNARYGTDLVFGGSLEASVVVLHKREGEWIAGLTPSFLLTEMRQDNTAFFLPLSFGYRAF